MTEHHERNESTSETISGWNRRQNTISEKEIEKYRVSGTMIKTIINFDLHSAEERDIDKAKTKVLDKKYRNDEEREREITVYDFGH